MSVFKSEKLPMKIYNCSAETADASPQMKRTNMYVSEGQNPEDTMDVSP